MASKPHWFPFYVPDFLSSPTVTMMSAEEVGGYVLLLCYAWQDPQGSLPSDDDSLRVLSRMKGDLTRLKSCFTEKKGRLYNKRLTQELEKVKEKSVAAKHSAAMRWHSDGNANALRRQCSSQSESQSQSESELQSELQSEKQIQVKTCAEVQKPLAVPKVEFEMFWDAYPRKIGKKAAQKAFQNAQDRPRIDDLLKAIAQAKSSPQWAKEGGQFIPHPATWLSQGRWDDQVVAIRPSVFEEFLARGHDAYEA